MKKKLLSIIVAVCMLFSITMMVGASTISLGSNASNYSSVKSWGAPGNDYHVSLTSASFNGMSPNAFPYGGKITMKLYYGTAVAGNAYSFTSLGSYNPTVFGAYRNTSGNYRIRISNESTLAGTFGYDWNP